MFHWGSAPPEKLKATDLNAKQVLNNYLLNVNLD